MTTTGITTTAEDGNVIVDIDNSEIVDVTFEGNVSTKLRYGNIYVWFEIVGPARAKQLLQTYKVDYRKFRESYADGLARDMTNGEWNFDGAPVRLDEDWGLFDAQHRLNAVIKSGTTQLFLFIGGLPVKAYNTTDTNLARTYMDHLRRKGFQYASVRQALVKLIHRWETDRSLDDTKRLTTPEMDRIHDKYMDSITWAVANSNSTAYKVDMPSSLVAFSWWVLGKIDQTAAKEFLVALADGENIRRGQPVYTLQRRLRRDRELGHTRNEYMQMVFTAWNAFRARDERGNPVELGKIQLPSGVVTREKMSDPK